MSESIKPFYKPFLPLDLQLFGGEGEEAGGQESETDQGGGDNGNQEAPELDPKIKTYVEKLLQSETDKIRTKYSQEKQQLERELNGLKKRHMTEKEREEHERQERERALSERERELNRKSLELIATSELATVGLPIEFRELVLGVDEKDTKSRIQTVKNLLDQRVEQEVTNRLRAGGRIPAGAGQKGGRRSADSNSAMNSFIRQAAGRK